MRNIWLRTIITVKIIVDGILRGSGAMLSFMVSTFTDLILRVIFAFILTPHIGQLGGHGR